MHRYYQETGTARTVGDVLEPPDREEIKRIAVAMRERAGSRKRFADLVGVESTSTPQGWEKAGRVPAGPQLAALIQLYPDLAVDLVRAIAPKVKPAAVSVEERAAANLVEGLRGLAGDGLPPDGVERRQRSRRAGDRPLP